MFVAGTHARAAEVRDLLTALATEASVDLLEGETLASRLGEDPTPALTACGSNLACIGGLGTKVSAREVLLIRIKQRPDEVVVGQFLVVDSSSHEIGRRAQLELATGLGLERQLRAEATSIIGIALAPPPDAVARCEVVEGMVRVQRRQEGSRSLSPGEELAAGDLVETGPTGVARIVYASGAAISLNPRSKLVIRETDEEEGGRITLKAGTVRSEMSEETGRVVVVSPDGERIELAADDGSGKLSVRVGVRDDDTVEVAVSEGRASVTTDDGATTLAAGSARDIRDGAVAGEVVELPDFPKLEAPGVDATVMFRDQLAVIMKWQEAGPDHRYRVQVAEDQSFHRLVLDEVLVEPTQTVRPTEPTTLHWRVATQDAHGREGEFGFARRIYITPEKIPDLLVSPADGDQFEFEPFEPRFISFSWRAAVPPAPYVLIFGKRSKNLFRPKVLEIVSTAQKVTTRQLKPGEYYWGVFVRRASGLKPIFRHSRKITIVQQ